MVELSDNDGLMRLKMYDDVWQCMMAARPVNRARKAQTLMAAFILLRYY